jgi:3-methyladenine DNA glycosylase/8-oxoguanine DNA glycosylase
MNGAAKADRRPCCQWRTKPTEYTAGLAPLVEEHGVPDRLLPKGFENMFASLARSIVYQQLAGNAAHAIHTRFLAACGVREERGPSDRRLECLYICHQCS